MKKFAMRTMLIMSVGCVMFLSACAKKSSSDNRNGGAAPRGDATVTTTQLGLTRCTDGSYTSGRVFSDSSIGGSFRQAWSDYFSATVADNYLGQLDGSSTSTTQGVNIELKLRVVNNQISLSESTLHFSVHDSYVGQKDQSGQIVPAIEINYSKATQGQLTPSGSGVGSFNLTFSDTGGTVTVQGQYNQQTAQGTVTFANSTYHDGSQSAKSGTLGQFSINSCGLFF